MSRVTHFEIQADDPERAVKFYEAVFGWGIKLWPGMEYWVCTTGEADKPGINGGILRRKGSVPAEGQAVNAYVCTIEIDSIDETIKKIEAAGGRVAVPKFAFPGMAWQAYYKDTEGNIFGIHQPDPKAQ